jgi:hypothetical protein
MSFSVTPAVRSGLLRSITPKKLETWLLLLILLFAAVRGSYLVFSLPLFDTSDELFHFDYIYRLSQGRGFINIQQDPITEEVFQTAKEVDHWKKEGYATPERRGELTPELLESITWWFQWDISGGSSYEGVQPPLYYVLAAGVIRLAPGHDLITQAYFGRMFSLLLSLILLWATYQFARRVSHSPFISLGAVALLATLPAQSMMSVRMSNDILAQTVPALLLLFLAARVGRENGGRAVTPYLLAGLMLAAGGLTKPNSLVLCLSILLVYCVFMAPGGLFLRARNMAIGTAVGLVLSSGWYIRNQLLYGDWSGGKTLVEAIYVEQPWVAADLWQAFNYNVDLLKQLLFHPFLQFNPAWFYWLPLNLWILSMALMLTALVMDSGVTRNRLFPLIWAQLSYGAVFSMLRHFKDIAAALGPAIIFAWAATSAPTTRNGKLTLFFIASLLTTLASSFYFTLNIGPSSERYILIAVAPFVVFWAYSIHKVMAPRWRVPFLLLVVSAMAALDVMHKSNMLSLLQQRLQG